MSTEVSIITAAYNASSTIEEAYFSLKKQTFANWEWIVVDDCSTDDTKKILKRIAEQDKRVILIFNEKNSGAAVSRNNGIDRAKGRFVAFIDADDLWKEEKIEKQRLFMIEGDYCISCTDYDLLLNGKIKEYSSKKDCFGYKDLLKSNGVGCSTVMYDTTKIGKIYMPIDAPKREDHAAWIDITKTGILIYKLDDHLTLYRVSNSSVSSKKISMFKYQYIMYRKHLGFNPVKSFWLTFCLSLRKIFKKYKY